MSTLTVRFEGPVVSRWLLVLELHSRSLLRELVGTVHLDLTGVTEVDGAGMELLKALASTEGVRVLGWPSLLPDELRLGASPVTR